MGEQAKERVIARHDIDAEAAKLAALFHDSVPTKNVAGLLA
jgi:HD superfamily phosphodiesterase